MKDMRFDTQDAFFEKYDGYYENGCVITGPDAEAYNEAGIPATTGMACYNIFIPHTCTAEQMKVVDMEKVKSIVKENMPHVLYIDAMWFNAKELCSRDKDELAIEIVSPMNQNDKTVLVKNINEYVASCATDLSFADAVAKIPINNNVLEQ